MSNFRNPDNYNFSYTEKAKSITELTADVKELEEEGVGVKDYNALENKPKINDVTLEGNKTSEELDIEGKNPTVEGERLIF